MLSPSGLPEVPCAKCGRRLAGLHWGDLCPECRAEREARASRLGRRISLAATVLMAVYVVLRVPADPTARFYAGIAALATYIIIRRIATRVAMEYLK